MSKSSENSSTSAAGYAMPDTPLIDSSILSSNPGTYEDIHKKTKGKYS